MQYAELCPSCGDLLRDKTYVILDRKTIRVVECRCGFNRDVSPPLDPVPSTA